MRRFRVEDDVEVDIEIGAAGDLAEIGVDQGTHEDQLLGQAGEFGIDALGQGQIGQRAGGQDRHLVRMLVDRADHELHRAFLLRLQAGRRAFLDGGDLVGVGRVEHRPHRSVVPGTLPHELAVGLLPGLQARL